MIYIKLECPKCGKIFERYEKDKRIKLGQIVYCSRSCAMKGTSRAGKWQKSKFKDTFEERFWKRVDKSLDCWIWLGLKNYRGYGVCKYSGKNMTTHRLSYLIKYGDIPDGLYVLHKCDNKACVNPDHLYLGTHKDNMNDMCSKGRNNKGEKMHSAKLKESDVKEILKLIKTKTKNEIAKMFSVSAHTIYGIKSGRTWKHIPR